MTRQQVNLYTAELRPSKQRLTLASAGALAVLTLFIVVGAMVLGQWQSRALEQQVERLEQQNLSLEAAVVSMAAQVQARQPDQELELALERVTETITRRQRLLERVEGLTTNNHAGFSGRLSALARQVPDNLWLTSVRLQSRPAALGLAGKTREADLVPQYLARLGEEPVFAGETFGDFRLQRSQEQAGRQWVEFRVATEAGGESAR